jgi:hypothetical protein
MWLTLSPTRELMSVALRLGLLLNIATMKFTAGCLGIFWTKAITSLLLRASSSCQSKFAHGRVLAFRNAQAVSAGPGAWPPPWMV